MENGEKCSLDCASSLEFFSLPIVMILREFLQLRFCWWDKQDSHQAMSMWPDPCSDFYNRLCLETRMEVIPLKISTRVSQLPDDFALFEYQCALSFSKTSKPNRGSATLPTYNGGVMEVGPKDSVMNHSSFSKVNVVSCCSICTIEFDTKANCCGMASMFLDISSASSLFFCLLFLFFSGSLFGTHSLNGLIFYQKWSHSAFLSWLFDL